MSSAIKLIERGLVSLKRLGGRVSAPPRYANQGRYPVLPISMMFYAFVILAGVGVFKLMVHYDDDISRLARSFTQQWSEVRTVFGWLTKLGSSAWALIASALVGLVLSMTNWSEVGDEQKAGQKFGRIRRMSGWYSDANFFFFTVLVSGVLVSLIKNTIGRARPKHLDLLGHLYFDFGAFEASFASFPSGHSTTFGAFCMALALLYPRFKWALLALALFGGLSRVLVNAHFPSDILVGLAFGAGVVWVSARYLARRDVMFRFNDGLMPVRKR